GQLVPEREQRALIAWSAGQERLFVATRSEPATGPTLWIVPVPAAPTAVKAEPVEIFPRVMTTRSVTEAARKKLNTVPDATLGLGSGLRLVGLLLGAKSAQAFDHGGGRLGDGVQVFQHIEKLGLVVEVLSAQSAAALDRYLADKQLDTQAAQLPSLASYFA